MVSSGLGVEKIKAKGKEIVRERDGRGRWRSASEMEWEETVEPTGRGEEKKSEGGRRRLLRVREKKELGFLIFFGFPLFCVASPQNCKITPFLVCLGDQYL
jgi:hypothetical protein